MCCVPVSVPTAAVRAIDWREYNSHEEPLFKRDVFIQWKVTLSFFFFSAFLQIN